MFIILALRLLLKLLVFCNQINKCNCFRKKKKGAVLSVFGKEVKQAVSLALWVTGCASLGEAVLGARGQAEKEGFQVLLPEPGRQHLSVVNLHPARALHQHPSG